MAPTLLKCFSPFVLFLLMQIWHGECLLVGGLEVPHALPTYKSKLFENWQEPKTFPYTQKDLTPEDPSNDQLFYLLPKFVHHAGEECRQCLTDYYDLILPRHRGGNVLDLCSSFTSHYPNRWKAPSDGSCIALGLNPLELAANPSKTEFKVQNLNINVKLPFENNRFDVITNSLSVDYLTRPLEVFDEMYRILKPGGAYLVLFLYLYLPLSSILPSIHPSIHPFILPSFHPSILPFFHPSIHFSFNSLSNFRQPNLHRRHCCNGIH